MATSIERKPKGTPRKSKKRLARLLASDISERHNTNRRSNLRAEMALLEVTPDRRFYGKIIIEPREVAFAAGVEASNGAADDSQIFVFVDGAFKKGSVRGPDRSRGGCGIAFKKPGPDGFWHQRCLYLPKALNPIETELVGIAEGLAMATAEMIKAANDREDRLMPATSKVDAGVKGNRRADAMARRAILRANHFIEADEGLQLMGLFPHPSAPCLRNPEKELERKLQRLRAESKKRPIFRFRPRPGSQDAVTSGLHGDIVDATGNCQHLQDYHEKVLDAL